MRSCVLYAVHERSDVDYSTVHYLCCRKVSMWLELAKLLFVFPCYATPLHYTVCLSSIVTPSLCARLESR